MRELCSRCRRPTSVCYCAALPQLETRTRVVILQHSRERDMPIGTARMASLAIAGASLRVGMQWTAENLADALGDPARPPVLLAPGPDARDILTEPPAGPVTLIVVDGTWSQARSLIRRNPILQTLPRYAFATPEPSQYRIRKEPRPEYVSTIEALMHVLGVLEGDPVRVRALLDPLRAMVDRQLDCQASAPKRTSYRRPRGPSPDRGPRLPAAIADRFDDLVCVIGEANAWPYASELKGEPVPLGCARAGERADELVHWVAHRPSTGETFERVVAPTGELSPTTLFHTELDADTLAAGGSRAALLADFASFSRPNDIVCTWGHFAHELFAVTGAPPFDDTLDLRAAAQRFENRKIGTLETYAPAAAPLARGRAGRRLAMIVQLVHNWRALAARRLEISTPIAASP
jgi:DTW domain-containing protein YfiP